MKPNQFTHYYVFQDKKTSEWIGGWTNSRDEMVKRNPSRLYHYVIDEFVGSNSVRSALRDYLMLVIDFDDLKINGSETYTESHIAFEAEIERQLIQMRDRQIKSREDYNRKVKEELDKRREREKAAYLRGGFSRFWVSNKSVLGNGAGTSGCLSMLLAPFAALFFVAFGDKFILAIGFTVIVINLLFVFPENLNNDRDRIRELKKAIRENRHYP